MMTCLVLQTKAEIVVCSCKFGCSGLQENVNCWYHIGVIGQILLPLWPMLTETFQKHRRVFQQFSYCFQAHLTRKNKQACCISKNCYTYKLKHIFPQKNGGGKHIEGTRTAGKMRKFRQQSLSAVGWNSKRHSARSLRFYMQQTKFCSRHEDRWFSNGFCISPRPTI